MASDGEMTLAQQRVASCPIKPCRGADDNETELRSIRSNRLLCMYCAVPTATGYIGRDEAKAQDDRFYRATMQDYVIVGVMGVLGGALLNTLLLYIPFGGFIQLIAAFFLGSAAGGALGTAMRRATGRRVGRQSDKVGAGSVVAGALISPTLYFLLRNGVFVTIFDVFNFLPVFALLICTGVMAGAVYTVFQRRI